METWIEIADTAVKVGLGAAIGGATTYFIAKLNHDKEMEKDRLRRKREILEKVADNCEIFSRCVRAYIALMLDWYDFEDPETEIPGHRERIQASQQDLYDGFHEMTSAECRLLLIGESESRDGLRAYGESVQELYSRFHIDRGTAEKEELKRTKRRLQEAYEFMFRKLNKAYEKNA